MAYHELACKSLSQCIKLDVVLTLIDPRVIRISSTRARERIKRRILRLYQEALHQGAMLSHEDLCLLLGLERTTVGKYVRELKDYLRDPEDR